MLYGLIHDQLMETRKNIPAIDVWNSNKVHYNVLKSYAVKI